MPKKDKFFLISNMYPSEKFVRYGIFVKNFEKALQNEYYIEKLVLTQKESISSKLIGYLYLYFKILNLIFKAKKKNIIYAHFPLHFSPALWFLNFFKNKIILNFHGSDLIYDKKFKKLLSVFLKSLIKNKFIVVPSNYYKQKIVTTYNLNSEKVFVYPSGGINTDVFKKKSVKKSTAFTLGFVSNFIESKGWKVFLTAVEKIVEKKLIPNIEVILIGDGPDKLSIDKFLQRGLINNEVISNLSQDELSLKYNEFDLFIFPTYRKAESLGLVGLEAMACGTPVIAGKVGGPMGYIDHGNNGFLFEKKDSEDLINKILYYFNLSKKEKEIIKFNAIQTATNYESTKVNSNLISFLEKLNKI